MAISAVNTFTNDGIVPLFPNTPSIQLPIKLLPSVTLAKGTLLGELAGGAAVGPLTIGSTNATTGTITASATPQTVVNSAGTLLQGRQITVGTAGAADFETTTILSVTDATHFIAVFSKTHAGGVALNMPAQTGTGVFKTYADANTDGSGVAKCILKYACATDSAGMITHGTASGGDLWGVKSLDTPAFFAGSFKVSELTGLDAAALADLNGHLLYGTITSEGAITF